VIQGPHSALDGLNASGRDQQRITSSVADRIDTATLRSALKLPWRRRRLHRADRRSRPGCRLPRGSAPKILSRRAAVIGPPTPPAGKTLVRSHQPLCRIASAERPRLFLKPHERQPRRRKPHGTFTRILPAPPRSAAASSRYALRCWLTSAPIATASTVLDQFRVRFGTDWQPGRTTKSTSAGQRPGPNSHRAHPRIGSGISRQPNDGPGFTIQAPIGPTLPLLAASTMWTGKITPILALTNRGPRRHLHLRYSWRSLRRHRVHSSPTTLTPVSPYREFQFWAFFQGHGK